GNTYSYLWQDGSSFPTFNVTEQGTYTAQVTANHCTTTHSMDVDILPVPDLDLEDNPTICEDETYIFDGTTLNVTDYLWQNGATTPTLLATNSGTYTLTVTSVNGCTTSDSEYLTIKPLPVFSLGADTEVCEGENYLLNVGMGNNTTYLWQDSTTNPTFNVSEPGTYSVQVTTDGCENEDEINIFYTSPPTVDLGNDTLICEGDELILDAYYDDMTTYAWQNNSDLPTFIVTDTGTYSVTLTNLCGSSFDKITIGQNQPPVPLFIGNDTILCLGDSYLLDATNTNTTHYLWQNGSNDSIMTIEDAGFYAVTWANACGFVTESFEVTTRKCDCPVIFPNVFSPNGDGWNEKFNTVSPCLFTKYNMKIFSRWGELLFETNDPAMDAGWDGTFKGKDVQVGVFIYVVEYAHEFDSGMVSGDVTITR
ncbi:MAG TPA: gliding motility-associated C-terminal domain-containing protein, partial [Phaeodactylibacter sp.]|nr:gliding motility-associated C-terminal domain-containing protein [Phaeodactylibacter sp.]